jgi:hypothetical protein
LPLVEVSGQVNFQGVGRPDGETESVLSLLPVRVGAQNTVKIPVLPLAEKVEIKRFDEQAPAWAGRMV